MRNTSTRLEMHPEPEQMMRRSLVGTIHGLEGALRSTCNQQPDWQTPATDSNQGSF